MEPKPRIYSEEVKSLASIPKRYEKIKRPAKVTVKTRMRDGKSAIYIGEGMLARAFCHEIDHLNGKLFLDL